MTLEVVHAIGGYVLLMTLLLCGYRLVRKWQDQEG